MKNNNTHTVEQLHNLRFKDTIMTNHVLHDWASDYLRSTAHLNVQFGRRKERTHPVHVSAVNTLLIEMGANSSGYKRDTTIGAINANVRAAGGDSIDRQRLAGLLQHVYVDTNKKLKTLAQDMHAKDLTQWKEKQRKSPILNILNRKPSLDLSTPGMFLQIRAGLDLFSRPTETSSGEAYKI